MSTMGLTINNLQRGATEWTVNTSSARYPEMPPIQVTAGSGAFLLVEYITVEQAEEIGGLFLRCAREARESGR